MSKLVSLPFSFLLLFLLNAFGCNAARLAVVGAAAKGGSNARKSSMSDNGYIECTKTSKTDYAIGLSEQRFQCTFPEHNGSRLTDRGSDNDAEPLPSPIALPPKHTLHSATCLFLQPYHQLPHGRVVSIVLPAISRLENQTCLDPGEAMEYSQMKSSWSSDWRMIVVNRGGERACEWTQDVANIGEALHGMCGFVGVGGRAFGGGEVEGVGSGVGGRKRASDDPGTEGWRWCLRFSERGWGEEVFEDGCFGGKVRVRGNDKEGVEGEEGLEL